MRSKWFLYAVLFCVGAIGTSLALELTGTISVDETSDTAASAKTKAFDDAQRSVILRELRPYADFEQLSVAIKDSTNEDLMNMISSSSLDSEKISDTTYSANISFVIDGEAARRWMDEHSVQHWLPASGAAVMASVNVVTVNAILVRPIADWMNLNSISRGLNTDLQTKTIVGNRITFAVPEKDITRFTNSLRSNGWQVQSFGGDYKIWK